MKKLLSFVLCIVMLFTAVPVSAQEGTWDVKPVSELTNDELFVYCSGFLNDIADFDSISFVSSEPVYDAAGTQIGYYVVLSADEQSVSMVLNFRNENSVSEYTLGSEVSYPASKTRSTDRLVYLDSMFLCLDDGSGEYVLPDGDSVNKNDVTAISPRSTVYAHWSHLFTDASDIVSSNPVFTGVMTMNSTLSEDAVKAATRTLNPDYPGGYYACAVVALMEVFAQYNLWCLDEDDDGDNMGETFAQLWTTTRTSEDHTGVDDEGRSVMYGSTTDSRIYIGFQEYCYLMNKTPLIQGESNPDFSYMKSAVDGNISAILSARIYVEDDESDDGVKVSGYSMNVLGYNICERGDGTLTNYLAVADGWHDYVRYFDYEGIDYARALPYCIMCRVSDEPWIS